MAGTILDAWSSAQREMLRRRALAFLPSLLLAPRLLAVTSDSGDALATRAMKFELHWNRFIRRLAGCPDFGDTNAATCEASKRVDYAEFNAARKAAIELFDLTEKR